MNRFNFIVSSLKRCGLSSLAKEFIEARVSETDLETGTVWKFVRLAGGPYFFVGNRNLVIEVAWDSRIGDWSVERQMSPTWLSSKKIELAPSAITKEISKFVKKQKSFR